MKVVLDTNVIVSGLLSPFAAPGEIVRMSASGILRLCYDARILCEYRDVLSRPKFHFDQTHIDAFLEQIESCGQLVTAKPIAEPLPDTNDEAFLEVALAGKVQYLVTGNPKHYPTKKHQGPSIVTPAAFLELYRDQA